MPATIKHYTVTNRINGKVAKYKTIVAAKAAKDRMDNAYGAICTTLRANWSDEA